MNGYKDRHGVAHEFGDAAEEALVRGNDHGHVFHSWSAQGTINPVPVAGGSGASFFDYAGNEYLDFGSQLVNLNLGHQHPDLVAAIKAQADRLVTIQPAVANDVRGELAAKIAEIAPTGLNKVFFTNGGADANENAVRMARIFTGRPKVLSMYRSYHGNTSTAIALTGDPRRWANEPTGQPVVHFFGPYPYRSAFNSETPEQETQRALAHLEQVITLEGAHTIAALVTETIVGTNGVLVPPPGYLTGLRELCDRYGIVWIADEVMMGFGRAGRWFAVDAFGASEHPEAGEKPSSAIPNLITFAKGVNSGYVPLGGVIISDPIAEFFNDRVFPGGLTYSGHPLACAVGVATFEVFERDQILERVQDLSARVLEPGLRELAEKHPVIGDVRGRGFFFALELVRNRETREPLVPFNASGTDAAPMTELSAGLKADGLWPFTHFNRLQVAPPLIISESDMLRGLEIIDRNLAKADSYVK